MASITTQVVNRARKRNVEVLTRKQWGSIRGLVYAKRRINTRLGFYGKFRKKADTVAQHITVTFDSGVLVGDFKEDMRTVERIGYERFGSGISYNFCVDMKTGMVGVGQPLDAKGTHTINDKGMAGYSKDQNLVARAIAVLGVPEDELSARAEYAIIQLLAAMVEVGAITEGFDYKPHSFFTAKDCPCDSTRNKMGRIREGVHNALKR